MPRILLVPVVVALLVAGACSGDDQEAVEVGQVGAPITQPDETSTTTTTVESTSTTVAPQVVDIPDLPDWASGWDGPSSTLGELRLGQFNQFVLDNAPGGDTTVEEAVVAYLQLDDTDDAQMLVGEYGGPEAYEVTVVVTAQDDSVRAQRYRFLVEYRAPEAEEEATEEGEAAETGDTEPIEDETAGDEAEAADEEQLSVIAGPEALPWILNGELTIQCQPGRGHQDFTVDECL